jgi:hypothetical protein
MSVFADRNRCSFSQCTKNTHNKENVLMTERSQTALPRFWRVGEIVRRHEPAMIWLGVMVYFGLVKLILDTWLPGAFADPDQAALFAWPAIGIYTLVGLLGVWLADHSGFPRPWTGWVVSRGAVLVPLVGGLALGAALVALDLTTGFTKILLASQGLKQQFTGYLPMFLIFSAASAFVMLIYRLVPLALLQWLFAERLLKGHSHEAVFWVLAVLTSLLEPLGLIDSMLLMPWLVALLYFLHLFGLNLFEATMFRRYGFLAAIAVRVSFYMIWHVIYIH